MHKPSANTSKNNEKRNLLLTIMLNVGIAVAELIGGIFSNSLALISDAIHNLADSLALVVTLIALVLSTKSPDHKRTFGYKRLQIMAALFNAITLLIICLFLIREAWFRFFEPVAIKGTSMFLVASFGLLANLAGVMLLHKFHRHNLNIRAAYLHLMGDTLSSVAVIAGSILIMLKGWYWVDPLVTLIISGYILRETWQLLAEAYSILMQDAPGNLDIKLISDSISHIDGIKNIHHVHIWRLTDNETHLEAHLEMAQNLPLNKVQELMEIVRQTLVNQFGISHITLQPELGRCATHRLVAGENCIEDPKKEIK